MTQSSASPSWEQPRFEPDEPSVTGQVLYGPPAPAHGPLLSTGHVFVAGTPIGGPRTPQEQTLRTIRSLIWPIALVAAMVTGHWLTMIILAIVVSSLLKSRMQALKRRRVAEALGPGREHYDLR